MRILFAGTPDIAVPSLQAVSHAFSVCGVLTNPDRVRARGKKVLPSPVKKAARELGLPVIQPERLLKEGREAIAEMGADLLVTFAYGRIFGPKFLNLFPEGGVNVHPSLLPQLRGSSPIQSAILQGLEETGITIQRIALEMDSGAVLKQRPVTLNGNETTGSLTETMAQLGAELLVETLREYETGVLIPRDQEEAAATYCCKIEKDARDIDWGKDACQLSREVRAYNPWPKAVTMLGERRLMITYAIAAEDTDFSFGGSTRPAPGTVVLGSREKKLGVVCGKGCLEIHQLQLESKREMDWRSFINGNPEISGMGLG